jgi:two-component system, cell cycle response regulator
VPETTLQPALDRVLKCASLPSLPGVAMRVLELTRKKDLSMQTLSETVQTDPALVARVLKTVNSSYYGLTTPCPSISRAMSLLGLNTVRSIVLGFSLLDMGKAAAGKVDLGEYWRRAVYGAAGAKLVAKQLRGVDPEEAFLSGLMRDLGMLACIAALKDEYLTIMAAASTDHNALPAIERESLGFDHTEVGAQLANKWRLPDQLAQSICYHHKPTLALPEHSQLVYCVALGGYIAGALSAAEPKPYLALVASKGESWLKLSRDVTKQLLADTARQAKDLATVLEVNTGPSVNIDNLLAEAQEQLVLGSVELERQASELQVRNDLLAKQTVTDSLTKAFNRSHFDATLAQCFDDCKQGGTPCSLLFFDADKFKSINDTLGHQAGDGVLRELAKRSNDTVAERGGVVCRYGGEEFGIILPGIAQADAEKLAERLRGTMDAKPFDLAPWGVGNIAPRVTISVGVSGVDSETITKAEKPEAITHAADQAVYVAKSSGRNRVCTCPLGSEPRVISSGQGYTLQSKQAGADAAPAGIVPTPPEAPVAQPAPAAAMSQAPVAAKTQVAAAQPKLAQTKPAPQAPVPAAPVQAVAVQAARSQAAQAQPKAQPPMAQQPVPAQPAAASTTPSLGTVVFIEDDPLAAKLVELLFQRRAHVALRTFVSAEAMLAWTLSPEYVRPSAVLSDCQLPGLSGVNLLLVMRTHPKLQGVPVALLSARVDDALIDNARNAGCMLVLSKADLCTSFEACLSKLTELMRAEPVSVAA